MAFRLWRPNRLRPVTMLAAGLLLVAGCGGGSQGGGGGNDNAPTVTFLAASDLPVQVAIDQGLYKGVNVEFKQVGEEQESSLFIGGDAELGSMSPWAMAKFVAEGEDIRLLTTAGATNLINGVLVRSEDAGKYKTIEDLKGKKLGIPGFGSDTWLAFATMVKQLYGVDAKKSFKTVTADPGAELGLLGTGQIDGALLFSGQTATGMAQSKFKLIFSFTQEWQKQTGQPLVADALVAKGKWAKDHPDLVKAVVAGNNAAVQWMRQHPDEFDKDGRYADLAEEEGWLEDPTATKQILKLLKDGEWYLSGDRYTQPWIDSTYKFVEQGKGILVTGSVPSKDALFYPTSE